MSSHKHIDRICTVVCLLSLLLSLAFLNGEALGLQTVRRSMGYETRLFDPSSVHTIDIVMDDWEGFLETCENEEYAACAVVIDGEASRNVGIRAKGNTSLTAVSAMGSDRYSFKIEFDRYDSGKSYYGLDKLSLNNLIQDTTCMKDYLTYRMMADFGVDAPLCSYVFLTVNGEDWGLYLAVEGVEEAFLQRNYGNDYGELYKPDSMSLGGGRGNGAGFDAGAVFDRGGGEPSDGAVPQSPEAGGMREGSGPPDGGGGFAGGMGSSDVKLQYIDDDPDSYPNIFDNAKTEITDGDKARLIRSLKALSSGEDPGGAVDAEEVIRYFAVHNFVCNGDSYTGDMVHNYYLYEEDGRLSMIPWDYNLAFGAFGAGDATGTVNSPIDTPVSGGVTDDRPMVDWIFADEEYTALYHSLLGEFLAQTDFEGLIGGAAELIAPFVERDPTKFCTVEEFETGVASLKEFCRLRALSVQGQLEGTVPATAAGQAAEPSALVDASGLELSDMGSMDGGMGGGLPGGIGADRTEGEGVPALAPDFGGEGGAPQPPGDGQEAGGSPSGAPGGGPAENPSGGPPDAGGQETSGPLLLAASAAVLLAGLAAALRFRR